MLVLSLCIPRTFAGPPMSFWLSTRTSRLLLTSIILLTRYLSHRLRLFSWSRWLKYLVKRMMLVSRSLEVLVESQNDIGGPANVLGMCENGTHISLQFQ